MKAFKFLASGAIGPISKQRWPAPMGVAPGAWVETEGPLEPCRRGAHVCRVLDLPYWIHDELWEMDTDGEWVEGTDCLVVRRARLTKRIDRWQQGGGHAFVIACAEHAARLAAAAPPERRMSARGYAEDAREAAGEGLIAMGALAAALGVSKLERPENAEGAYRRERAWQAGWIVRTVIGE